MMVEEEYHKLCDIGERAIDKTRCRFPALLTVGHLNKILSWSSDVVIVMMIMIDEDGDDDDDDDDDADDEDEDDCDDDDSQLSWQFVT